MKPAEKIKMRVLKKHFDAAEKERKKSSAPTTTCLVAQAAKDTFPKSKIGVSYDAVIVNQRSAYLSYDTDSVSKKLIERFDHHDSDRAKLRASLPKVVSLKLNPYFSSF